MGAKQKPKRESKKQPKKPAQKVAPSPDFAASIIKKGWHMRPYGGAA